jgi:hypothetical protein
MPAVPPMPSTRCGCLGSTPPMGMRQYSSSSMDLTCLGVQQGTAGQGRELTQVRFWVKRCEGVWVGMRQYSSSSIDLTCLCELLLWWWVMVGRLLTQVRLTNG